jgi:hypothetical protein
MIMNAKKHLKKMAICCITLAFAVMIGFSGCGEDYSPQIRNLNDRMDSTNKAVSDLYTALNTKIIQIQSELNSMVKITEVVPITTPPSGFTLKLSNGSEYTIRNGSNGTDGTPGSVWEIDIATGKWKLDGSLTEYNAIGIDGNNGLNAPPPYINNTDTTWYVTQWNAQTNKYDSVPSGIKANGRETYVVYVTGSPGSYTLHVKNQGNSDYIEIPLFSSSSSGTSSSLEVLGYVQGNVISSTANLSLKSIIDTTALIMDCWRITTLPTGYSPWNHEKYVQPNQILTTLKARQTALVVSSNMGTAILRELTLYDSKNVSIPLKFGEPVPLRGYLTRAAGPTVDSIYYIPIDSISGSNYTNIAEFEARFTSGTLFYLATTTGIKSNFSKWTINAIAHTTTLPTSQYSYVDKLDGTDDASGIYTIATNKDIPVTFDANSTYIYDYYITYPGTHGVTIGSNEKTFSTSVTIAPQDTVIVHKLYVDGVVERDTVKFKTP